MRTLIGPESGGVAHVSRSLAAHWPEPVASLLLMVIDEAGEVTQCGCSCPPITVGRLFGWSTALAAARAAWGHRSCLRVSESLHVELGRTSLGAFWFALAAGTVARRVPLVLTVHDVPTVVHHPAAALVRRADGFWNRVAYRLVARALDGPVLAALRRRAAATVVLSRAASVTADAGGWPKVTRVDHGALAASSPAVPPGQGAYVLLAGYLGPGKGLDVLAAAWPEVESELPLVIAGGCSEQHADWVARRRADLDAGANPPTWLGYVDDATFDRLVRESAVVVIPYEESNPASGVLVRALVEGRAVVGTRVAAMIEEIVDEENGLLVEPGDALGLAAAISRLVGSSELRNRLGRRAALTAADRHSWDQHTTALLALHQALSPHPSNQKWTSTRV